MSGMILRLMLLSGLFCGLLVLPFSLAAQQAADKKPGANKPASNKEPKPMPRKASQKDMPVITPEREAAALTFVREHHPELAELIAVLKERQPREYQKALRDLFRASEKLAQIHDLDRARYELELQAWKLQSRIQLLTARLTMQSSDKLRSELKQALDEQYDTQLALVRAERERIAQRLATLDKQLANLEQRRSEAIARQLEALMKETKRINKEKPGTPASATGTK